MPSTLPSPSGSRIAIPSSDQIVWTSIPRRSRSRASIASDHGAWTRPPNGDSSVSRQSPSSSRNRSTTMRLSVGQGAGRVALVLEVREQVLGGAVVEVVVVLEPLRGGLPSLGSAVQVALELPDERAERAAELDRAADGVALPERQLARDAGCGRDRDAVVADVLDPPGARPEDDDVAVHPGSELVDHLLVELADATARGPGLALHEDAEQATIRDGAAARHGHDARVAATLDGVGHAIPHEARLELGELVGWVGAGEHAEDAVHDVARQGLVRGGLASLSGTGRRRSTCPSPSSRRSAERARRAGCAGCASARSRPRACAG